MLTVHKINASVQYREQFDELKDKYLFSVKILCKRRIHSVLSWSGFQDFKIISQGNRATVFNGYMLYYFYINVRNSENFPSFLHKSRDNLERQMGIYLPMLRVLMKQ